MFVLFSCCRRHLVVEGCVINRICMRWLMADGVARNAFIFWGVGKLATGSGKSWMVSGEWLHGCSDVRVLKFENFEILFLRKMTLEINNR